MQKFNFIKAEWFIYESKSPNKHFLRNTRFHSNAPCRSPQVRIKANQRPRSPQAPHTLSHLRPRHNATAFALALDYSIIHPQPTFTQRHLNPLNAPAPRSLSRNAMLHSLHCLNEWNKCGTAKKQVFA